MKPIKEVFKQFCKERHDEDKGKNFDMLQEIYANTEFFDISLYKHDLKELNDFIRIGANNYKADFPIEDFCLPFSNIFIKESEQVYVFIREYSPEIITGTVYTIDLTQELEDARGTLVLRGTLNVPFRIFTADIFPYIESNVTLPKGMNVENVLQTTIQTAIKVSEILNTLSRKSVTVDKPSNPDLCEYYRRRRKPTIKVPQKPIYYVLGEKGEDTTPKYKHIKAMGQLEYSHAFHVRGHWRRINEKTYGKDRNGVYNIVGYTWVTEYVKGEGELVKRLRVIK